MHLRWCRISAINNIYSNSQTLNVLYGILLFIMYLHLVYFMVIVGKYTLYWVSGIGQPLIAIALLRSFGQWDASPWSLTSCLDIRHSWWTLPASAKLEKKTRNDFNHRRIPFLCQIFVRCLLQISEYLLTFGQFFFWYFQGSLDKLPSQSEGHSEGQTRWLVASNISASAWILGIDHPKYVYYVV